MLLDPKLPAGPIADSWERTRESFAGVSAERKSELKILVVGTGLAGASAAATLAEQGYQIRVLSFHDSPRRAHSVAAQGGINAARALGVDAAGINSLFIDTVRGGDFRAREVGCQRLAEISSAIIDQCVAQGVPFAREYGGQLTTRRFGGALVSRTFYARGQTGQQLLYGAYQALMRQVAAGRVELLTRRDVLELITVDGVARGVVCRHLLNGELEVHTAQAVVVASGGYSNVYFLSTNSLKSNASAIWRAHLQGAGFANPCFTQIHPTCIPSGGTYQSKLTLMSESLRNDGRVWLPLRPGDGRSANEIPEPERDYFLERQYPTYGNMVPRDVASRRGRERCNAGHGVGPGGRSIYLDLRDAIASEGRDAIETRYGNLLEMYERISGDDPYQTPMRIYPAPHYTMGGLWVDYQLMSSIPGLFVLGEANFSEHGANRLGASALMQCLADGYFIAPATVTAWLSGNDTDAIAQDHSACRDARHRARGRIQALLQVDGSTPVDAFHRELGVAMIERCGISRDAAGLRAGLKEVAELEQRFQQELCVPGGADEPNPELEKALRVADFFGLAKLMLRDALAREESCGAHFRQEHQTADGEALRNDEQFAHIAIWEHREHAEPLRHIEPLSFTAMKPTARSYR
ncbi:fumarate reductase/succinate dehydrogenase flavoprotein subunit [Prochlorococcus sp. MIT 1306]|uniref:fumarate reductase/succinate dehydrogenase flavoprotein subunit n=1 Tax=Prochlorococcus sp. MIT 1306 TaxID=1799667 RepID=UPI0007B3CD37|nr:fumarate reductase/succinate dehydrogenase flavoprotein subunit [Prochlorococcus sp. MIT 1306]KZR66561.1 Fumarate reductase flavoprotein subunit [Prochlorococcus sp. MIT 1306]